jgi:hypothetical protein
MQERLTGMFGYCSGPMDEVPDMGVDWRLHIQDFLWGLGCGVLNPCNKPTDFALENGDTREKIKYLKGEGLYDEVAAIMKPIASIDLRMVDKADFLILHIDKNYHMTGSYGEQSTACIQRKPVIVHCEQGKDAVPNWLWGVCNHNVFFGTWDEVKSYLIHIHEDENVDDFKRWRFFNNSKIFGTK